MEVCKVMFGWYGLNYYVAVIVIVKVAVAICTGGAFLDLWVEAVTVKL